MNITSRFTLLAGAAGLLMAGCSAPADEDGGSSGPPPPPGSAPPFAAAAGQGGAGQVTPSQGGASSTPAGAGTGGAAAAPVGAGGSAIAAGGAAGAGGAPGAGNVIPIGMGLVITPDATGWVAGSTNQFGIQGPFFAFNDNAQGGATMMTAPTFAGGRVCVSGVAGQVQNGADGMPAYGAFWGGGIGLNLAQPIVPGVPESPAQPWQRGPVTGFSFNVTGSDIPTGLAFRFKTVFYEGTTVNDTHCATMTPGAGGLVTVKFSQVVAACYTPPGGVAVPPTAALQQIQWQVATNITADEPFNFCIENLTPVTTP